MTLNKSFLFLLFSLLITSCASGLRVSSKYCNSSGAWESQKLNRSVVVKEPEAGFGIEEIYIKTILDQNGYDCQKISNLSIGIERSSWDAFLSAFPGYSSQTLVIKFDNLEEY